MAWRRVVVPPGADIVGLYGTRQSVTADGCGLKESFELGLVNGFKFVTVA